MNFIFLNIYAFFLFIPVFFFLFVFYRRKKSSKEFSAFKDLEKVYTKDSFLYKLYYIIIFLFLSSLIVFWANPSLEVKKEKIDKKGVDIEIVLDISYSMIAEDLKPNRLEVAKGVIKEFLETVDYARIGMIVFAGRPFEFFPLSSDLSSLKESISFLDTSIIDQNISSLAGTALGDAMALASDSFDFENKNGNIIILITDGEANKGGSLKLMLKYIKSMDIKVYTIGIGGDKKTYIQLFDGVFGFQKIPVGALDEETLKKISLETGGKYFRAKNRDDLIQIFEEISKQERKMIKFVDYVSFRFIAFGCALLFLLGIIILRITKFKNN